MGQETISMDYIMTQGWFTGELKRSGSVEKAAYFFCSNAEQDRQYNRGPKVPSVQEIVDYYNNVWTKKGNH